MPQPDNVVRLEDVSWGMGLGFIWAGRGQDRKLKPGALKNVELFLGHHPDLEGLYWYDEFADEIFIDRPLTNSPEIGRYPRPIQDHDEVALASWFNTHGLNPSVAAVAGCMRHAAFACPRNPILEWANGLRWDGKRRIDTWLTYYAGAENTPYVAMVGRRFLVSAMARLMRPGCKADTMLILEGAQGLKKSSLIEALAGKQWFSDQVGDVTSKDASQVIQGIWIMEVAEMDKFSRTEASAVKAFLSRKFDRYRPPYGRNVIRRERRCVFFGTINPDGSGYLKDTTGNRRYWPVPVSSVDLDGVLADRDQLWAEAKAAFESGEHWWIDDDADEIALVEGEQDARREDDVWESKIQAWLDSPERKLSLPFFTSSDLLWRCLQIELKHQGQREKTRVSKILKMLGYRGVNHRNGISGRSWELDT